MSVDFVDKPYFFKKMIKEKLEDIKNNLLHYKTMDAGSTFIKETKDGEFRILKNDVDTGVKHPNLQSALAHVKGMKDPHNHMIANMGYAGFIGSMYDHKGNKHCWSDDQGCFIKEEVDESEYEQIAEEIINELSKIH